jgi:hypothetical protein
MVAVEQAATMLDTGTGNVLLNEAPRAGGAVIISRDVSVASSLALPSTVTETESVSPVPGPSGYVSLGHIPIRNRMEGPMVAVMMV